MRITPFQSVFSVSKNESGLALESKTHGTFPWVWWGNNRLHMFALALFPGLRMRERTSWYPLFVLVQFMPKQTGNGVWRLQIHMLNNMMIHHRDQGDITTWELALCCPDSLSTLWQTLFERVNPSLHKDLLNPVGGYIMSYIWICLSLRKWWKWKLPVQDSDTWSFSC